MAHMEFIDKNVLDTTTMLTVLTNSTTIGRLFDRLPNKKYTTVDYASNTSATIKIDFGQTVTLSRLILQNHNLKQFRVFYDGVTANALTIDNSKPTSTSVWTENSTTNDYIMFSTIQATSLTLQMDIAQTALTEKQIGQLWVGDLKHRVAKNPVARDYKPTIFGKQVEHELSDGGKAIYSIADKFRSDITFTHVEVIDSNERNDFKVIFDSKDAFGFIPFPTGTAWDGYGFQVVWTGNFDFLRRTANEKGVGWTGTIKLREVPA